MDWSLGNSLSYSNSAAELQRNIYTVDYDANPNLRVKERTMVEVIRCDE